MFLKTEFEVKILNVDVTKIKEKLDVLKAKKEWEALQKRKIYDFSPVKEHSWIRLRTNNEVTTITIKDIDPKKKFGTKELELVVEDFDKAALLLEGLGFKMRLYQENKRIQYSYKEMEIDIDFWPLIPPYVEIEGNSEKEVYEMVQQLGYSLEDCCYASVEDIYKKYGYVLNDIKKLIFEEEI